MQEVKNFIQYPLLGFIHHWKETTTLAAKAINNDILEVQATKDNDITPVNRLQEKWRVKEWYIERGRERGREGEKKRDSERARERERKREIQREIIVWKCQNGNEVPKGLLRFTSLSLPGLKNGFQHEMEENRT